MSVISKLVIVQRTAIYEVVGIGTGNETFLQSVLESQTGAKQ
jgi:hypothetical protein